MEPESLAHRCVLRAQVDHHDRFTSPCVTVAWTDSGMGRGRSASFSARPTTGRIDHYEKAIQIDS
jgi:hypothetical protein